MMEEAKVDFILTEREYEDRLSGFPLRVTDCEICGLEAVSYTHLQGRISCKHR